MAANRNDWDSAVRYFQRAADRTPLPEFLIGLGEAYEHLGKKDEANAQFDLVRAIQQMYRANGVSMDIEMALFEADHGERLQDALTAAQKEWSWRKSIRVADAYAWTLYRTGHYDEADRMMKQALRLGTKDPLFLRHAEAIRQARG